MKIRIWGKQAAHRTITAYGQGTDEQPAGGAGESGDGHQ
jgi:hypothetical protein